MRETLVHLNQSLTSSFVDRGCFVENQPKKCNFLMCSIFMPYHLSLRVSHTREGMFSFVRNEFEHVVTIALSKPSPTKLSKREQEKEWALATTNVPGQNNAYWGPHKQLKLCLRSSPHQGHSNSRHPPLEFRPRRCINLVWTNLSYGKQLKTDIEQVEVTNELSTQANQAILKFLSSSPFHHPHRNFVFCLSI